MIKKNYKDIYKKWNYLIFLNNLIILNWSNINQKIIYLKLDLYKKKYWIYKKPIIIISSVYKNIFKLFYI